MLRASFLTFLALAATASAQSSTPAIDKAKLAEYIRYAEGIVGKVDVVVDDPIPVPSSSFYILNVHLRVGQGGEDRQYYLSPDGQQIIQGSLWSTSGNPFMGVLRMLPSSGPVRGPENARVSIVVFSDFECPFCKQLAAMLRDNLLPAYGQQVRIQFSDFFLESIHPWARAAAEAAHCIGDHDSSAFWTFHDWIFEHQGEIDHSGSNLRKTVLDFAGAQHWDADKIGACIDAHATAKEVTDNENLALRLGLKKTPVLFIDGRKVEGFASWQRFEPLLRYELDRPADILAEPQRNSK